MTALSMAAVLLVPAAHRACAGAVSVSVKNASGIPAEDAVVVFDPLDATPAPGHDTGTIDQIAKHFVPKVSVFRTGTVVSLPNSDSIRHEVYSTSPPQPFKLKLYASSHAESVTFNKPGLLVLGCNIHDSMVAFVVVVDSPFFAKTPPAGTAHLDLPPGRYRLRVWHPKLRTMMKPVEISVDSAPITLPLILDLDPARDGAPDLPH